MTFIFTSSIDYTGSVCNASFINPEDMVFKLKCLLKTVGWSVVGSGSGSFSAAYDLLPTSASMFASRSWFAIKNPNSNSTFTFQRENVFTSTYNWRIKYSPGGYNISTANSITTPTPLTASDELYLLPQQAKTSAGSTVGNSGTDASPVFGSIIVNSTDRQIFNIGADSANGSFWFTTLSLNRSVFTLGQATNGCNGGMIYSKLLTNSYPAEDVDPYLIYISGNKYGSTTMTAGQVMTNDVTYVADSTTVQISWAGTLKRTSTAYGTGSYYGLLTPCTYGIYDSSVGPLQAIPLHSTLASQTPSLVITSNPNNQKFIFASPAFGRRTGYGSLGAMGASVFNGFKGVLSDFYYASIDIPAGTTFTVNSTRDYISMGRLMLPWNGTIMTLYTT